MDRLRQSEVLSVVWHEVAGDANWRAGDDGVVSGVYLMDWITGALTIIAMELVGRKMWQGWLVGLLNQAFWVYLIIDHELYGLIPLTAILTWRYSVHVLRWRNER